MAFLEIVGRWQGVHTQPGPTLETSSVLLSISRGEELAAPPDVSVQMPFLDAMALLYHLEQIRQQSGFQTPGDQSAH